MKPQPPNHSISSKRCGNSMSLPRAHCKGTPSSHLPRSVYIGGNPKPSLAQSSYTGTSSVLELLSLRVRGGGASQQQIQWKNCGLLLRNFELP